MHILLGIIIEYIPSFLSIILSYMNELIFGKLHWTFYYLCVGFNAYHIFSVWDVHDLYLRSYLVEFFNLEVVVFGGYFFSINLVLFFLLICRYLIFGLFLRLKNLKLFKFLIKPIIIFFDLFYHRFIVANPGQSDFIDLPLYQASIQSHLAFIIFVSKLS